MDWVNPHSHLIFEVTTPEGKTEKWMAETPPPNGLYRAGWRQSMIKGGEEITVNGYLAKDGDNLMWAQSVDFADGRRITLNSSPEPAARWRDAAAEAAASPVSSRQPTEEKEQSPR